MFQSSPYRPEPTMEAVYAAYRLPVPVSLLTVYQAMLEDQVDFHKEISDLTTFALETGISPEDALAAYEDDCIEMGNPFCYDTYADGIRYLIKTFIELNNKTILRILNRKKEMPEFINFELRKPDTAIFWYGKTRNELCPALLSASKNTDTTCSVKSVPSQVSSDKATPTKQP